jgi:hypothetical protein
MHMGVMRINVTGPPTQRYLSIRQGTQTAVGP